MEINAECLRQRYSAMETDELIELRRKGGLTDVALGVLDDVLKSRIILADRYQNPVEQVMFILGFKHEPRFETVLDAIENDAPPGILDASEYISVHGAIDANFVALAKVVRKVQTDCGMNVPFQIKGEIHKLVLEESSTSHYGGQWFDNRKVPSSNWVHMDQQFSPHFRRRE
jgi:hypothetical protein